MVAGMAMALLYNKTDEEALACGMAAAGGSLGHQGTKLCLKEDLERLLPLVRIHEITKIPL